jgi:catechol 2,3-dioxygenase-like lactoylglutathione lyase family enzyme
MAQWRGIRTMEARMRIGLSSVLVDDQEKALAFYAEKLGFFKKTDIPAGEYHWLTVIAPDGDEDVALVLEPVAFPPAKVYQEALFKAGIPATAFISDDVQAEYTRLRAQGVRFDSVRQGGGNSAAISGQVARDQAGKAAGVNSGGPLTSVMVSSVIYRFPCIQSSFCSLNTALTSR